MTVGRPTVRHIELADENFKIQRYVARRQAMFDRQYTKMEPINNILLFQDDLIAQEAEFST